VGPKNPGAVGVETRLRHRRRRGRKCMRWGQKWVLVHLELERRYQLAIKLVFLWRRFTHIHILLKVKL